MRNRTAEEETGVGSEMNREKDVCFKKGRILLDMKNGNTGKMILIILKTCLTCLVIYRNAPGRDFAEYRKGLINLRQET